MAGLKIKGYVAYQLESPEGDVLDSYDGPNLITTIGRTGFLRSVCHNALRRPRIINMAFGESNASVDVDQFQLQGSEITEHTLDSVTRVENSVAYKYKYTNSTGLARTIGEIGLYSSAASFKCWARFLIGGGQPLSVPNTYKLDVTWTVVLGAIE